MSRDRQLFDVRAEQYGPNLPPQGYWIDLCYHLFWVGKRPGWGWMLPVIERINTDSDE